MNTFEFTLIIIVLIELVITFVISEFVLYKYLKKETDKKTYKLIRNAVVAIIILFIPFIIFGYCYLMNFLFGWSSGDTNGWLGFLGAYFGAIIAVGGVYWQVNKSFEHEHEKELNGARGKLTLETIGTASYGDKIYYEKPNNESENNEIIRKINQSLGKGGIRICNASANPLSLFHCQIQCMDNDLSFTIPIIKPYSSFIFEIKQFIGKDLKEIVDDLTKNSKSDYIIKITYITKVNEKRYIEFKPFNENGELPIIDKSLGEFKGNYPEMPNNSNYMVFNKN